MFGGIAKISDLPLPYESNKSVYFDRSFSEKIGYLDPNSFLNENFKKEYSMDIYSLGSLLWEIASEKVPFLEDQKDGIIKLVLKIKNQDYREKDILDTHFPIDYRKLYHTCWNRDSSARPSIQKVYEKLSEINK